jgi:hypothetical protein
MVVRYKRPDVGYNMIWHVCCIQRPFVTGRTCIYICLRQHSQPHLHCRYCYTESKDAVYVGVMGSLTAHDWAANLNVLLTDIWQPDAAARVRLATESQYALCMWRIALRCCTQDSQTLSSMPLMTLWPPWRRSAQRRTGATWAGLGTSQSKLYMPRRRAVGSA